MKQVDIIEKTQEHLKERLGNDSSGHDYWHVHRVWRIAKQIAAKESGADMFVVELGALLHDIADWKLHDGDEEVGPREARKWLESLGVNNAIIEHIEDIIRNVSFKGAHVETKLTTLEGQIIYDADKLDAIGAIGIGRTFAYGGNQGRLMHDPERPAQLHQTFEAYKNNDAPTINHFYEKLLLLKDRMFTKTGRELAEHRHKIMEQFLDEFLAEWEGAR